MHSSGIMLHNSGIMLQCTMNEIALYLRRNPLQSLGLALHNTGNARPRHNTRYVLRSHGILLHSTANARPSEARSSLHYDCMRSHGSALHGTMIHCTIVTLLMVLRMHCTIVRLLYTVLGVAILIKAVLWTLLGVTLQSWNCLARCKGMHYTIMT